MDDTIVFEYMNETIKIAREALNKTELPIGAIIVRKDEILATAHTQDKTMKRRLVHAEFLVLEEVDKLKPSFEERKEMALFTNLEPCFMCLGTAIAFGIGKVYYALESPIDGATKLLKHYFDKEEYSIGYNIPDIRGGILREESKNLFKEYLSLDPQNGIAKWARLLLKQLSITKSSKKNKNYKEE
ncbi:MAG: nucleoside deaminase [Candidatus Heimdallarchaeota archaeon]|nr:nucleoside deaminase [Candidatus Heimdallarchaeota archaeon]MCK5049037.1 nucleoside deaminase [Candidatus Heimdallarchaeota archaeon]